MRAERGLFIYLREHKNRDAKQKGQKKSPKNAFETTVKGFHGCQWGTSFGATQPGRHCVGGYITTVCVTGGTLKLLWPAAFWSAGTGRRTDHITNVAWPVSVRKGGDLGDCGFVDVVGVHEWVKRQLMCGRGCFSYVCVCVFWSWITEYENRWFCFRLQGLFYVGVVWPGNFETWNREEPIYTHRGLLEKTKVCVCKDSVACATKTTLLLLAHPSCSPLYSRCVRIMKINYPPCSDMRAQWQDRKGGGGRGVCHNWNVCELHSASNKSRTQLRDAGGWTGGWGESAWRSNRRNGKINKWWQREGCRCTRGACEMGLNSRDSGRSDLDLQRL